MFALRRITGRPRLAMIALVAAGSLVASCTLVGQGDLHIANDESGIGANNTILRAFAPDSGDPFPPSGYLNLFVRGDDFGKPPAYGMNGYLYLVRTDLDCAQSEGAPEAFTLDDVTIVGVVTVTNGSVNQFLIMPDSASARESHWALIEVLELPGYPELHLIHRCGEVSWG